MTNRASALISSISDCESGFHSHMSNFSPSQCAQRRTLVVQLNPSPHSEDVSNKDSKSMKPLLQKASFPVIADIRSKGSAIPTVTKRTNSYSPRFVDASLAEELPDG